MPTQSPVLAFATALVLSSTVDAVARAADSSESGVSTKSEYGLALGIRSGYAIPIGSAASNSSLSDSIQGMVPIWIDAGFRFSPYVYLGAFFQYGFGIIPSNAGCTNGISCSESDVRLGINVHYHFVPAGTVDPWIGIGAGYEWFNVSASGNQNRSATGSLKGWEFANLQLGTDFRLSRVVSVGPFVALTIAEYASGDVSSGSYTFSADIPNKAIHGWVIFGLRGQFNINFN